MLARFRGRHSGAVLIVLLVALLSGSGLWLLEAANADRHLQAQRQSYQQTTAQTLAHAKEALIAYAVNYADDYGHNTRGGTGRLPCPAETVHSSPGLRCSESKSGYLPMVWTRDKKRIDIDHVERFLEQDLWYAVSPTYRYNPSYNVLNSNSNEDLISVSSADNVVAVIIAPGLPLPGQYRSAAQSNITDYLEAENADHDLEFALPEDMSSNDQMIWITEDELLPLIEKRVLGYVKQWLTEYYSENGHYPYAAPFDDPEGQCQQGLLSGRLPMLQGDCVEVTLGDMVSESVPNQRSLSETWFSRSAWSDLIFYQIDQSCSPAGIQEQCDSGNGELVVDGDSAGVVLGSAGSALLSADLGRLQIRDPDQRAIAEYFETPALLSDAVVFDVPLPGDSINDQFVLIR